MKLLFDFFPVILFFIAYKIYDIYTATAVAIIAAIVQVTAYWIKHRRVEKMLLLSAALIVILGGFTIFFHQEVFIKWKPTAINWAFGLVFLGSHFIGDKPLIQRMLEENVSLPDPVWSRLNISWVSFFLLTGTANILVAYHFDTDTWVNFKLFGILGLTVIFVLLQAVYLSRHIDPETVKENDK